MATLSTGRKGKICYSIRNSFCLAVVLILFLAQSGFSQHIISIKDSSGEYITPKYMMVFEDPENKFQFKEISSPDFESRFIQNKEELPINRNRESAYWGKITIQNESNATSDWLIEFPDQRLDRIELYTPDSFGNYKMETCGDGIPFYLRTYNHKNCIFKIPRLRGKQQTFYFRIQSDVVGTFTCWIRSEQFLKHYALNEYLALGFFYGIIAIMIVFNLSLYFSLRDSAYLYYVLYVISIGLFSLFQNGIGFQYLWSDLPEINNNGRSFGIFSLVVWQLLYTRSFLRTQKFAPLIHKLILYFIVIRSVIFFFGFFFSESLFLYLPIDNIPLLLSFLAGIIAYRNGFKSARFFLLGFSMLFFGFVVHSLTDIEIIPNSIITVYAHDIGGSLEMLFLSLALADRLKIEKSDKEIAQLKTLDELEQNARLKNTILNQLRENDEIKDKINRELEAKIEDRTSELKAANTLLQKQAEEILRINSLLQQDNSNLKENYAEMERAKVTKHQVDFVDFKTTYPDENSCIRYLYDLKWGASFLCKKCNSSEGVEGKEPFSIRCVKCNYLESVTSNTLFHGLKMSLHQAFHILYQITNSDNDISIDELSEKTKVARNPCYNFKLKIKKRINEIEKQKGKVSWKLIILSND